MGMRFRGKLGPFVVDAPLTKKAPAQGALSRRESLALLGCLILAGAPCLVLIGMAVFDG